MCVGDDSALVAEPSGPVEDWQVEPRVVGAEAGSPYHGSYVAGSQVECEAGRVRDACPLGPGWRQEIVVEAGRGRPLVGAGEKACLFEVGQRADVAERARKAGNAAVNAGQPSNETYTARR